MSSMELYDFARGDSISPDGSLREFRYSQFTQCASAPFNTPESEFLPSQFRCSDSLTTPSLVESEGGECRNEDPCREISPESLCLTRSFDAHDEGVRCTPTRGDQLSLPCSDSLGLSLFDESRGSKECEGSPRRIFCDPRLLEEETQVSDFGVSATTQQDSHLLSPIQHLQSAPQAFGYDNATEEIELLALRKETVAEPQKLQSLKREDAPSTATIQKSFAAFEDCDDIVQRWHNRKRVALAAINHQNSASSAGTPKKLKQATENSVETGTLHSSPPQAQLVEVPIINDQKNCGQLPDPTSPSSDVETSAEDVSAAGGADDSCESRPFQRKLNYLCTRDIKSFWQPITAPKHVEERKWSCPRKYRSGGRQRTMDAWVK